MCTCVLGYRGQELLNPAAVVGRGKKGKLLPGEYLGAQLFLINPNPLPSLQSECQPHPTPPAGLKDPPARPHQPGEITAGLTHLTVWKYLIMEMKCMGANLALHCQRVLVSSIHSRDGTLLPVQTGISCLRYCPHRGPWTLRLAGKFRSPALAL